MNSINARIDYQDQIQSSIDLMRSRSVIFEDGLTDNEIALTERHFGFVFPTDLRAFLQTTLPVAIEGQRSQNFPNWRLEDRADISRRLDWPFEGMAFDIEHNLFWLDSWGTRPRQTAAAIEVARCKVASAPKMIPVFSHRYLPDDPREAGNPVFSIHQTDIIYYGQNLWDYIEQEFGEHEEDCYGGKRYANWTTEKYQAVHRQIRFWSELVS